MVPAGLGGQRPGVLRQGAKGGISFPTGRTVLGGSTEMVSRRRGSGCHDSSPEMDSRRAASPESLVRFMASFDGTLLAVGSRTEFF